MTPTERSFRARLAAREPLSGAFVKTPSHQVVEVLALGALDAVVIDAEHAPFDPGQLDVMLAVAHAHRFPCLVRVAEPSRVLVQQALDGGATGVLVPHVDTADRAREVVRWCRFGEGGRGYSGSTRAAGYGTRSIADVLSDAAATTTVVVQIEDPVALDHLDEIAGVDGLDAIFVGVADLTVGLGCTDTAHPWVVAGIDAIVAAARRADVPLAAFAVDGADADRWRERGATFVLTGTDQSRLRTG
jgi:2-keto-3-deoxy-L-rhamnonate aldolase RhmA